MAADHHIEPTHWQPTIANDAGFPAQSAGWNSGQTGPPPPWFGTQGGGANFAPPRPLLLGDSELEVLAEHIRVDVVTTLGAELSESRLDDDDLHQRTVSAIEAALAMRAPTLDQSQYESLASSVINDLLGLGPLEHVLSDDSVSEVMVNGPYRIFLERNGIITESGLSFRDEQHVRRTIDRIVARVGRRVDESSPMVDARLPDGSRINAVIPPAAVDGPTLTVRKFRRDAMDLGQLIAHGTLTPEAADFLAASVRAKLNMLVAGATGAGKTTMLNALSAFISDDERIVTIEDAAELQLHHSHLVRLESRPPGISGRGEITIRDLLRNALRMRPDRIIVGEVRDAAAMDMLQAMNTGHSGSLGTVHASSARDALRRIETMVLLSGVDIPLRAIREQIAAGIDVIVYLTRDRSGARRVSEIVEVAGMESDVVTLQPLFAANDVGGLESSGFEPHFWSRLAIYLNDQDLPRAAMARTVERTAQT